MNCQTLSQNPCTRGKGHQRTPPGSVLPLVYPITVMTHHLHHLSLSCEGCLGTTDNFITGFLSFTLFSTAVWDLANSRPVHSLIFFSHLFLCLPCLPPLFTVSCTMVFARPNERETCPYNCSLHLFGMVRRSLSGLIACLILARMDYIVGNMVFVWDT